MALGIGSTFKFFQLILCQNLAQLPVAPAAVAQPHSR